eukprot:156575-Chlamydomonas_euryale.AAC.5
MSRCRSGAPAPVPLCRSTPGTARAPQPRYCSGAPLLVPLWRPDPGTALAPTPCAAPPSAPSAVPL